MNLPAAPALTGYDAIAPGCALLVVIEEDTESALPLPVLDDARSRLRQAGIVLSAADRPMMAVAGEPGVPAVFAVVRAGDSQLARDRAAEAIGLLRGYGLEAATVVLTDIGSDLVQAVAEGVLSANWRFETREGKARGQRAPLSQIDFAAHDSEGMVAQRLRDGWLVSIACLSARHLVTQPANELTPPTFASCCRSLAARAGFDIQVLEEDQLEKAGMGGLLAVAAGSRHGPFLIRMDWRPSDSEAQRPLVLVGKTVTFDSGGISLKKSEDMDHMKADMGGGAAVFGAMAMIAEARPPFPVTAIFPVAENVLGPDAMRPSDVIRVASGATVEIINTDAEGRLILADALHVAAGLDPVAVIDLATLTGATMGIFGPIGIASFANDDAWFARLRNADQIAGEKVWRMPLWAEYRSFLASPVADLRNFSTTGQNGSTPIAAAFLSHFIGNHPWLHLDIYNTCWSKDETALVPQGPTGSGTRVLSQMIINLQNEHPGSVPGLQTERE